nr:hypothetical protein BgiMline_009529 [Biomphalaria glabrata]
MATQWISNGEYLSVSPRLPKRNSFKNTFQDFQHDRGVGCGKGPENDDNKGPENDDNKGLENDDNKGTENDDNKGLQNDDNKGSENDDKVN